MERRHLTVMFVDLVGSTRLAHKLDPEDLLALTLKYQDRVFDCVGRLGGHVARVVGDGMLVLFGWPAAQEDAPARAIRSALAIHEALPRIRSTHQLQCRIGIASGLVVVGDVAAKGITQSNAVFGETPNLAARLQEMAEPGGTVASSSTRQSAEGLFTFRSIGQRSLAGFETPVEAFVVTGENTTTPQHHRRPARIRAPLVGRRAQLAALMEKWDLAKRGQGQIVSLTGEAGIGKSRLLHAQRRSDRLGANITICYHCSPFHKQSAFYPFIEQTERWCGIGRSDTMAEREGKLRERVAGLLDAAQTELLVAIVAPGAQSEDMLATLSEQRYRKGLLDVYLALLRAYASQQPLLLHFEDIHWIDPSSRAMIKSLARELAELPVLLVLSHRPDPKANFLTGRHISRLQLEALSASDAKAIVRAAMGDETLDDALVDEIVSHTNGVPLFIEEYTSTICDRGADADNEKGVVIPDSLYDLLTERLDNLGEIKDVALAGAAFGRAFGADLLSQITGRSPEEAREDAETLVRLGIFSHRTQDSYRFHHVLVQEAAYRSMVRAQRTALHLKIARIIEALEGAQTVWEPDFLAYHFQKADDIETAIRHWIRAAKRSLKRFANREAVQQAEHGLALLDRLSGTARQRAELNLRALIGSANRSLRGYGDPETLDAFRRAFELADQLDDSRIYLNAARGLFTGYQVLADYKAASAYGYRVEQRLEGAYAQMVGQYMIGVPLIWQGRFLEAHDRISAAEGHAAVHAAQSWAARPGAARSEAARSGQAAIDTTLTNQVLAQRAVIEAFLGNHAAAVRTAQTAIDQAEQVDRPLTLANALLMACNVHQILHHEDCLRRANALDAFARAQGLGFYIASATCMIAVALYQHGEAARGYEMLKTGWQDFQATTSRANQVLVCTELARGCWFLGRYDEGLEAIEEGRSRAEAYDERNFEAELYRLKGELMLDSGYDMEAAREALTQSCRIARHQGARLFEWRALRRMTRLEGAPKTATERFQVLSAELGLP